MNKKNLKLYIDNQIVDLQANSIAYNITKRITDYSDISQRNGDFSYSLKLPITKTNQKIFKHINLLYTVNKFNKNKFYECSFYCNDNLLIDGYFIYQGNDEKYFNGYITNKIGGIFNLFGEKTLQDIESLPKIDFEGVMLPITSPLSPRNFNNGTADCLNPNLCFDFFSLMNAKKHPAVGKQGSSIDYSDIFRTPLIAYSNFPTDKDVLGLRSITNSLSLEDFRPTLRLNVVLQKLFEDIGYTVDIQVDEIDDKLMIPYVGRDSPEWNWLHLSRASFYNDLASYDTVQKLTWSSGVFNNRAYYNRKPLVSSRIGTNRKFSFSSYTNNQYTDIVMPYGFNNKPIETCLNANIDDYNKLHLIPLSGIKYDFNNSFRFYNFPSTTDVANRNTGQIYNTPASGKYEFDISISHDIRQSHFMDFRGYIDGTISYGQPNNPSVGFGYLCSNNHLNDYDKKTKGSYVNGYVNNNIQTGTWNYTNYEKFYIQNMVLITKNVSDPSDIMDAILETYKENLNQGVDKPNKIQTIKRMKNIESDNVIAFYHPMLRDLYGGESGQRTWEEFLDNEKTLYKENITYPLSEEAKLTHFGFGKETEILQYDNNITSDYYRFLTNYYIGNPDPGAFLQPYADQCIGNQSSTEQLQRKLVKMYNRNNDRLLGNTGYNGGEQLSWEASAKGNVDWKFTTNLAKGDQVRMYYITMNQFADVMKATPIYDGYPFPYNGKPQYTTDNNPYADFYADEINVNKFNIKCIDDAYESKLRLGNFLPAIKQETFIKDFIKSNNLYFDIQGNNITFKSRGDTLSNNVQKDLTPLIDKSRINISPIENFQTIQYGFNYTANDDYKEKIKVSNPPLLIDNGQNIYLKKETLDLSSKIFNSSFNTSYKFYFYNVVYDGRFKLSNDLIGYPSVKTITLTSLNEGGSSSISLADANLEYGRSPRILYYDETEPFSQTTDYMDMGLQPMMINGALMQYSSTEIANTLSDVGALKNANRITFFNDKFSDLQDSSYVEVYAYLNEVDFANLKLTKPVSIDNSIYYIQTIDAYNPLLNGLTKIKLLRL